MCIVDVTLMYKDRSKRNWQGKKTLLSGSHNLRWMCNSCLFQQDRNCWSHNPRSAFLKSLKLLKKILESLREKKRGSSND